MKIKYFIICFLLTLCFINQAQAGERLFFRHVNAEEIATILQLYQKNDSFAEAIRSHFLDVARDIRILYHDLNDDGQDEMLIYFRAGYYCGTAGCEVDIWQKKSNQWVNIGEVTTMDKGILIYSRKTNGFHVIHGIDHVFHFNGKEY